LLLSPPLCRRAPGPAGISGTVVDSSDQVLPGATITLVDEATGATRTLTSNERGEFAFARSSPAYTVVAELQGFRNTAPPTSSTPAAASSSAT
jgi:hypothetical protein